MLRLKPRLQQYNNTKRPRSSSIGLEIGAKWVVLVELSHNPIPKIERYAYVAHPVNTSEAKDSHPQALIDAIQTGWQALQTTQRHVTLALPNAHLHQQIVSVVPTIEYELDTLMAEEASRALRCAINEVCFDYAPLPDMSATPGEHTFLLYGATSNTIRYYVELLQHAGLVVDQMSTEMLAIATFCAQLPSWIAAQSGRRFILWVGTEKTICYSLWPGRTLPDSAVLQFSSSWADADGQIERLASILLTHTPGAILIFGSPQEACALQKSLCQGFNLPAQLADPLSTFSYAQPSKTAPLLTLATGLALMGEP